MPISKSIVYIGAALIALAILTIGIIVCIGLVHSTISYMDYSTTK